MSAGSTSVDQISAERVPRVALLDDDLHRPARRREPQRLARTSDTAPSLRPSSPTRRRSRRSRASRGRGSASRSITSKKYLPRFVSSIGARRIARPLERLEHDAVEAEALLRRVARVVVVHAHRAGRRARTRLREQGSKK